MPADVISPLVMNVDGNYFANYFVSFCMIKLIYKMATKRRVDNDDTTHLPSRLSGANSDNSINIARIAKLPY